ncbi:MAG TPA: hypothetical protein VLE22_18900 [Bryobacteraceae bacterium]|nr:hypothetical protein [Bryobacteraceae bacterium]
MSWRTGIVLLAAVPLLAGLRPHPRVEVDAELIAKVRELRKAGDLAWARFDRWTNTSPEKDSDTNRIVACMFHYLVSNEEGKFNCAWQPVQSKVYRNGTDRSGGLMPLLDLYNGDKHTAAYQGGVLVAIIARVYDWGYGRLSPEQRQDVVEWLNDAVAFLHLNNDDGLLYLRNDGASVTQGVAAATYATLGENPKGEQLMAWFRERWRETLKGLDIMGKGGATGEGNAYGTSPTGSGIITAANVAYTAAGEDLFLSHVWFRQRLLYDAFAAYPGTLGGPGMPTGVPREPMIEQASIAGDGRRAVSWHNRDTRRNGLVLARRFAGTEEADTWNWVFRQPEVDHPTDDSQAVYELVYYSPRPRLVKPKRLSFFDPSMGFVYIRSDWDSPDATWISFWAGPHIDTHQHLDQGTFTVFKRRDLAPKTGHYDSDVFYPHHLAYYIRTVSSNGILVGDPKEIFRGFIAGMGCDENGNTLRTMTKATWPACIPNDGGQRTMAPQSLAVANAAQFERYRDIFDVARVVSFKDDGRAVFVVADITNAYNNPRHTTPGNRPKVNRVYRRVVYIRGLDVLAVADTVESTEAKFEKKWLLHALERIEIGGEVQKVGDGETVHQETDEAKIVVDDTSPSDREQTTFDLRRGYAALNVKTLFPVKFRYRKVGGREPAETPHADLYTPGRNARHLHRHVKDFWVKDFNEGVIPNHKSVNWAPERPLEAAQSEHVPVFGPGYGRWRLEVEPDAPGKTDYFLNILKPALNPTEKMPNTRRIESDSTFGAEIVKDGTKYTLVFSKDGLEAPKLEIQGGN